jgi:hypothetical protein
MDEPLRQVAVLGAAVMAGAGPVALLLVMLNRRDRRQARLFVAVCEGFPSEELRSDLAIHVRCGLLGRRAVVTVDMRGCAPRQVWEATARLRGLLPPVVQLRLEGPVDQSMRTRLTVERVDSPGEAAPARGLAG